MALNAPMDSNFKSGSSKFHILALQNLIIKFSVVYSYSGKRKSVSGRESCIIVMYFTGQNKEIIEIIEHCMM